MLKKLSVLFLIFLTSVNSLIACWAAPKPIVYGTSEDKLFKYSLKRSGEMSIKESDNKLWDLKLKAYSGLFDRIFLIEKGTRVVQILGNHRVNKIDDAVIYVYNKNGKIETFLGKEFIQKLEPGSKSVMQADGTIRLRRSSKDPKVKWLQKIEKVDEKGVTIVNAKGKTVSAKWEKV
jgi:hypothetical protein